MCPSKETLHVRSKARSGIKYSSGEVTIPTTCVGRETRKLVNVAAALAPCGSNMLPLHTAQRAPRAPTPPASGISTFLYGISIHFLTSG